MTYLNQISAVLLFLVACLVLFKGRKAAGVSLGFGILALALIQAFDPLAMREAAGVVRLQAVRALPQRLS